MVWAITPLFRYQRLSHDPSLCQCTKFNSGTAHKQIACTNTNKRLCRYPQTQNYSGFAPIVELHTELVFFGRYRSVFLGIYHNDTKGKLVQYFWYQNFGGSPLKNWLGPLFVHFALLLKKDRIPVEFFKKRVPANSYSKTIPTKKYWYRLYLIPGVNTDTEKMTGTTVGVGCNTIQ